MAVTVYRFESDQTGVTDEDAYFPDGGFINTKGAEEVTLITHRESEGGTCTWQPFAEFYFEQTGLWMPLLDFKDATQVQGVIYANGETDALTPFHRFLTLRALALTPGATTLVALNTVHKVYQVRIPERLRFRFRTGGASVDNHGYAQCEVRVPRVLY